MNNKLQEALRRQKIRFLHRSALRKAKRLHEENLYKTFVEPFTDVLDAAKLTGQDILSSAKFSFDMLTSFSPEAQVRAMNAYDKRHEEIQKKWEPILDRNREALTTGDADIIAMVMAPHLYITSEAALRVWDKAENIYDFLDQSGWRVPLAGIALGGSAVKAAESKTTEKKDFSLLDKLAGLFYIGDAWKPQAESVSPRENLLTEQEGETQKPKLEDAIQMYFEESGIDDLIQQQTDELMQAQSEFLEEVLGEALPKLQLMSDLGKASDFNEFTKIIEGAKAKGVDLEAAGLNQVKAQIDQAVQKLLQSEEFKQSLIDQKQGDKNDPDNPPEISEDEAKKAAEKIAFVNAKQNFDKQVMGGKEKLKSSTLEIIDEKTPPAGSAQNLKKVPEGIKLLNMIEDAKQKIQNA